MLDIKCVTEAYYNTVVTNIQDREGYEIQQQTLSTVTCFFINNYIESMLKIHSRKSGGNHKDIASLGSFFDSRTD